ncbi:Protein NETWORKED 4A [Linum grandiflorum]
MASTLAHSRRSMKRLESRKSHSWWWDSHINPKNSKWLMENLDEMDRNIKRMLKLIEEDGDSFAKKAEMYYQKRPELISLVEEFYRMYRSLAERYDNVTGELRKSIPVDLQSQGSNASDLASEPPSSLASPVPGQHPSARKSGPRAAGFDFFLGSAESNSDHGHKEGEESLSLTDSDSESDNSSVNNYLLPIGSAGDQALTRKIVELESELRETKNHSDDLLPRIAEYELELKRANERIHLSEEETVRLKCVLEEFKSADHANAKDDGDEARMNQSSQLEVAIEGQEAETLSSNGEIQSLTEELSITKARLEDSEKEMASLKQEVERSNNVSEKVSNLQDQLASARKELTTWKNKVNIERKEVSKLQERVSRLKISLTDRDQEVRELKTAVSDAEEKIFPEKAQIKAEMSKLLEEQSTLMEQLREWESRGRCLEDDIRMLQSEKAEMEERHSSETEQMKAEIVKLESLLSTLRSEREKLKVRANAMEAELVSQEQQIDSMEKHLEELHKELAGTILAAEDARREAMEMEEEAERQRKLVEESAEEKREAIRQLCVSIEHYRVGYRELRQALFAGAGHGTTGRVAVMAA